jgi:hypothetical protein
MVCLEISDLTVSVGSFIWSFEELVGIGAKEMRLRHA